MLLLLLGLECAFLCPERSHGRAGLQRIAGECPTDRDSLTARHTGLGSGSRSAAGACLPACLPSFLCARAQTLLSSVHPSVPMLTDIFCQAAGSVERLGSLRRLLASRSRMWSRSARVPEDLGGRDFQPTNVD